jgi:predicted Fe-Mo cluster-binding NifX family protein
MFAIVSKADGYPVSRSVGSGQPDLVVTWTSGEKARAFLSAKGIEADYAVVALTEDALNTMARALGCDADAIAFDSYPEK